MWSTQFFRGVAVAVVVVVVGSAIIHYCCFRRCGARSSSGKCAQRAFTTAVYEGVEHAVLPGVRDKVFFTLDHKFDLGYDS